MEAIYINSSSFSVEYDKTEEFLADRRLKLDCGADGIKYTTITSSSFTSVTVVVIDESVLTVNLTSVLYSVVKPGVEGNLSDHYHTTTEGDGGYIASSATESFLELTDTPSTYLGTTGYFAVSTGSGINLSAASFLDLDDTPSTYSGTTGNIATSTGSGVEWTAAPPGSFLDLDDTPSTYVGTTGQFATSTGSGVEWTAATTGSFLDLSDTPSTYSGTSGQFAVSTGSGIALETLDYPFDSGTAAPADGDIDDFYVHELNSMYKKKRVTVDIYTTKSVILDCLDTHGGEHIALRSVDFWFEGAKITNNTPADFVAYETSYVVNYDGKWAFHTNALKTGNGLLATWQTSSGGPQRLICVFNDVTVFDEIRINNHSVWGGSTDRGVKNVKIYFSTDEITSTVYGETISSGTLIYDGTFDEHVASNVEDEQILSTLPADSGWDVILETTKNFTELEDTPSTYIGTTGQFATSTGSGVEWTTATTSFLELTDTPSTYSGAGMVATSTSSGVEWTVPQTITTGSGVPSYVADSDIDDFYVHELNSMYKKKRSSVFVYTAKSVILDVLDNYGNVSLGIRAIDFWFEGSKITNLNVTDFVAYSSNDVANYNDEYAFDTSKLKTGQGTGTAWAALFDSEQRLICVFNSVTEFDEIRIVNYHNSGATTDAGVKNVKIYFSTDTITSTVYGEAIANSTLIYDGTFDEHTAVNEEDEQILSTIPIDTGWDVILATTKNFTELEDTPSTYSGTTGQFAVSTGSGVEWVASSPAGSFLDLDDTPTTYSGLGMVATSTSSGVAWTTPQSITTGLGVPAYVADSEIEDYYIDSTNNDIYEKTSEGAVVSYFDKYVNEVDIAYSRYLGSNNNGNEGFSELGTIIDNGDYYTFDGTACLYSSVSLSEPYDVYVKISIDDLTPGTAQIIWKSGGLTNGYAVGLNTSGDLGVFARSGGTLTSVTISESNLQTNTVYNLYINVDLGKIYLYSETELLETNTGTITAADGADYEAIAGLSCTSAPLTTSPITASTYGTGTIKEPFEGDIYEVELFPTGTFVDSEMLDLISYAAADDWTKVLDTPAIFTDLEDTPTTYSGGQYLRTVASGVEFIDGIILTSPDTTEWLIQVTNSGTLYTTEV